MVCWTRSRVSRQQCHHLTVCPFAPFSSSGTSIITQSGRVPLNTPRIVTTALGKVIKNITEANHPGSHRCWAATSVLVTEGLRGSSHRPERKSGQLNHKDQDQRTHTHKSTGIFVLRCKRQFCLSFMNVFFRIKINRIYNLTALIWIKNTLLGRVKCHLI